MYDNIDASLDVIAKANEYWSTVPDHCLVYVDTNTSNNTDYLNNLSVPCFTEPKYWDGYFTLDNPTLCILTHLVLHRCSKFCINTSDIQEATQPVHPRIIKTFDIYYKSKRPFFGWIPIETFKRTFDHCTQHMQLPPSTHLQKHFKSPNIGANIFHCHEADATDISHSNNPDICGIETQVHTFFGIVYCVTDVYKAKKQDLAGFLVAFQDRVCTRDAPTKLIVDNAALYY